MDSGVLLAGAIAVPLGVALAPVLVELAALVRRCRPNHPTLHRESYKAKWLAGGPTRTEVEQLPVKSVQRIVVTATADEVDPYYFFFTVMGRSDELLAVLKQGHCLFSELPLVLSSSLDAWEKWILDPASAPGVVSL